MSDPTFHNLPSDQAMLLRLIDAKFETMNTKIDGVGSSLKTLSDALAAITARYDSKLEDHEHRISEIEAQMAQRALQVREFEALKVTVSAIDFWKTEEQTTTRNASKWGAAVWAVLGSAITAIIGWIIVSYVQATATPAVQHPQPQHSVVDTRTRTRIGG